MHDQPTVDELVQAVKNFVDEIAMKELTGRSAFLALVTSNVLGTILRDLEARQGNDEEEKARLSELLGSAKTSNLLEMNKELQRRIRDGDLTVSSPGLMAHLKKTAIAQLQVDQPNYSALQKALKEP